MEHYCPICKKTHGLIKEIDGTQPIYVGFNTRYKGVSSDGYLPAFYPERLCKPNLTGVRGEAIQSPTPTEQDKALAALSGRVAYQGEGVCPQIR